MKLRYYSDEDAGQAADDEVTMKPIDQSIGRIDDRPRYIVNSQLNILTPVGTAITITRCRRPR